MSAELVEHAEPWRWGSLWAGDHGPEPLRRILCNILCNWPVDPPANWPEHVKKADGAEGSRLFGLSERGEGSYGDVAWVADTVKRPGLEHTVGREGFRGHKATG